MAPLRKIFLTLIGFCGLLLWAPGCTDSTQSPGGEPRGDTSAGASSDTNSGPRHVLLIVIDTLRADHLSCYGYWRKTSPNIDALGRRGVRFERAISQSSWTSPSMITLMTGQRLSRKRYKLPEDKPTLAECFKDAGYRTGAWVSNPLLSHKNGFHRGFDEWTSDSLREIDGAVQWLHENADRDTFTWVHFTDPHDPYKPPRDLRSKTPGRLSASQEGLIAAAAEQVEEAVEPGESREFIAKQIGLYDDEIVAVDHKVGLLLRALEKDGNLDRAIVVLTSDHGECLWQRRESDVLVAHQRKTRETPTRVEHILKMTHGEYLYQELVRVPLIIAAPGLTAKQVEPGLAESLHLAPTMLALAGIEVEGMEQMVGVDLFGGVLPTGAYTMTNQGEAYLSADGWKLILPTEEGLEPYGHELQLYDLEADPEELHNLASERPELVAKLTVELRQRRDQALPLPQGADWDSQARANAEALQELGYADAGFLDLGDEDQEHGASAAQESPTKQEPRDPGSDDGL